MLAAGILFATLDASGKHLVLAGVPAPFTTWVRFSGHVVVALLLLRIWNEPGRFRARNLPAHGLRGLFLLGSTMLNFYALKTLQLAETAAIFFFAPMVITALAGPVLGERAGWRRWAAILVGFIGVLVITRPGIGVFGIGHVYALCAMLSYSGYVLATRRMAAGETAESLILYGALTPALVLAPTAPFMDVPPLGALDAALLALTGLIGGVGHWFFIQAHRQASATALAPYPYLQMAWMIAYGYFVFGQFPHLWTLLGVGIIIASGLYIVHREHVLRVRARAAPNAEAAEIAGKL